MEPPNHFQTSAVCHGTLKSPLQEARLTLAFLSPSAYSREQRLYPAFGGCQPTVYIGAGWVGRNVNS